MDRRQFLRSSIPAGLSIAVSGCVEIFTSAPESSSESGGRAGSGPAGGTTTDAAIPARLYNVDTNSTATDTSEQSSRTATIETGSPPATTTESPHRTATRTTESPSRTPTPDTATPSPTPTPPPSNDGSDKLEILEHGLFDDFSTGVRGTVVNNADHAFDYVEVTVWFRDSGGSLIGDGLANTLDLGAGEEWLFKALFMGDDPTEIDHYDIDVSGDVI